MARPRMQSAACVSADGKRWFLLNASPEIAAQIARFPPLQPPANGAGVRKTPIEGVLLTNADLDHTLGVLSLRETKGLSLYASRETRGYLARGKGPYAVLESYMKLTWYDVLSGEMALRHADGSASVLRCEAFPVPGKAPKFAARDRGRRGAVGYQIRDGRSGRSLIYAPDVLEVTDEMARLFDSCDLLFFDGTFWSEREMAEQKINRTTASAMGHLPIGGRNGSLRRLARISRPKKVYVHINNTNPILMEKSRERAKVREAGWEIGEDGMEFEV